MNNPLRWLALVLLDEPRLPEFDEVARFIGAMFPNAPSMQVAGSTENLFTCTIGEYTAAVTLVPRPVPWSQLEGPCATAWYWPTATEALKDHKAHLLVALVDEGSKSIDKSTALTQLVCGLVGTSPVQGVFWGPGRLVHPPQAFLDQAQQMSPRDLPLFLWIDFRVERTPEGSGQLYTTGLEALGKTELEIRNFSGELQVMLEYAYNVAHYQLCKHKQINDGDTIELTDEVQAVAHLGPSMFDADMEVVQLEFQSAAG
ncbi:MAG: DUF4261 domain-containing protein [Bythopirellula sp.]|nr:DUF4261 domain-containing protein [Bythopirellula sp.]